VRNVGRQAGGMYQCFVSNAAGTVSAAAKVHVIDDTSFVRDARRNSHHQSDVQNIAPDGNFLYTAECFTSI